MPRLGLEEAHELGVAVLRRAGAGAHQAEPTAAALVAAEAAGQGGHGLSRLPAYADQVLSGKIDGEAVPGVERPAAAVLRVDAAYGFAYPAIALGLDTAAGIAGETGIVGVAVRRSHHAGAMAVHVERVALQGHACLAFSNSPAAIAPWGGRTPLFGTNPVAFACPRAVAPPLVVDLSLSRAARGRIMVAARRGEPIPEGWALDVEGRPTTDPTAALAGAMLPMGDAKGAALVLAVEILTTVLTGARFGFEAGSFFTAEGPPPGVGQLFLVLDPERTGGPGSATRLEALIGAILGERGTRLPGERRLAARARAEADGLEVDAALLAELEARAAPRA